MLSAIPKRDCLALLEAVAAPFGAPDAICVFVVAQMVVVNVRALSGCMAFNRHQYFLAGKSFSKATTIYGYVQRSTRTIIAPRRPTADYRGAGVMLLGRGDVEIAPALKF